MQSFAFEVGEREAVSSVQVQLLTLAVIKSYKLGFSQLEEEKRRQKIAMWESMQEGKSYKGNLKLNQVRKGYLKLNSTFR